MRIRCASRTNERDVKRTFFASSVVDRRTRAYWSAADDGGSAWEDIARTLAQVTSPCVASGRIRRFLPSLMIRLPVLPAVSFNFRWHRARAPWEKAWRARDRRPRAILPEDRKLDRLGEVAITDLVVGCRYLINI